MPLGAVLNSALYGSTVTDSHDAISHTETRRHGGSSTAQNPRLTTISFYISLPVQVDAMNAQLKAPPPWLGVARLERRRLRRGGGPVCGVGGVFTVICAKLLNIAQALRRTLPSRFAIHLPLVREGADWCELHAPPLRSISFYIYLDH